MAVYRARWEPDPGRTGPRVRALGHSPEDPDAHAEREQLVADLEQYTLDVVERHHAGDTAFNSAVQDAVRFSAADGTLGRVDLPRTVTQLLEHATLGRTAGLTRAFRERTTETASSPTGNQIGVD